MKRFLKPLLVGVAWSAVTFPLSSWVTFSLLLRYYGFDHVPTDPDYNAAIAMGSWACLVRAVVCGSIVGLSTIALVTRYLYRRNEAKPLGIIPS